jgi:hypothetical protein
MCRAKVPPPREAPGFWYDFLAGTCRCGAIYVHDPSARNGGACFLQGLLMNCDGDMDRAISLSQGVDYDDAVVHHYEIRLHRRLPSAIGSLYFVRLRRNEASPRD